MKHSNVRCNLLVWHMSTSKMWCRAGEAAQFWINRLWSKNENLRWALSWVLRSPVWSLTRCWQTAQLTVRQMSYMIKLQQLLNFIYKFSSEHGNNRFSKQNQTEAKARVSRASQMSTLWFKKRLILCLSYKLLKKHVCCRKSDKWGLMSWHKTQKLNSRRIALHY